MSFIGPKLLSHIDERLHEAFPHQRNTPFGGCSIILVGDLGQLPPVKDIPLYAGTSHGSALWNTFNTVITLDTTFRQQGDNITQVTFRNILQNIRDANPTIDDYNILMSRTNSFLSEEEICSFHDSMHLFPINAQTMVHNKQMMKSLNTPIARSIAEDDNTYSSVSSKDEQLERIVLLCNGEKVMLTSNLWVSAGLVNGSLGKIVTIFYKESTAPPQIPTFVVVDFPKYIGPPWDERNPTHLPIPAVKRNDRTQIPLKMAWALTIHKSRGMTLPKATIDIGKIERQGLTFTAISRVPSLQDLWINPAFSFDRYSKMNRNNI